MATIFVLIAAVCYEVVARYVFAAPTLWAFDASYMLTGSVFVLAIGLTTQENGQVRIDFLSSRMPVRAQHIVNLLVTGGIVTPCMIWITYDACRRALNAARTGEVEPVSPWAPLMWPFYTAIAVGLVVFCLQLLATTSRHAMGVARPDSVDTPSGDLKV
ncbi:MAG: TRAP transporter small permease subunit [Hyphomicrobiaceae bacterium]|nr:TRAP transporter small permease subunit [Hyphomicrobiaceae bacterium]